MPNPEVRTIEERVSPLKKALVATTIAVSLGSGIMAEDRFNPDIELRGRQYTGYEYRQLRGVMKDKIANRKTQRPQLEEAELWKAVVDREIKQCGGWQIRNATPETIVDQLNEKLSNPC